MSPAVEVPAANPLKETLRQRFYDELRTRKQISGKHKRADAVRELREAILKELQALHV